LVPRRKAVASYRDGARVPALCQSTRDNWALCAISVLIYRVAIKVRTLFEVNMVMLWEGTHMTSGELYRAKAADMAARARADATRAGKAEYARLCVGYLRLAEQADRRVQTAVIHETMPVIAQNVRARRLLHRLLEQIDVLQLSRSSP
jgi:hypothetical protein